MHQHDPPRQFAYFREATGVVKAFTDLEFKLNFIFTSRAREALVVTDVVCTTRFYRRLANERLLTLTKPKGFFRPETVRFSPSLVLGGEVHLLGDAFLNVPGGAVELFRAELEECPTPGIYELEFHATISTGSRLSTPGITLVVTDLDSNARDLTVFGKHYDSAAEQLLGIPDGAWDSLAEDDPNKMRILGPSQTEIVNDAPPPTRWQIREITGRQTGDGMSGFFNDSHAIELLVLDGTIGEELHCLDRASARTLGRGSPRDIHVDEQIRRRQLLVTR